MWNKGIFICWITRGPWYSSGKYFYHICILRLQHMHEPCSQCSHREDLVFHWTIIICNAISIYKMQRNILKTQNMHWIKCIFYFLHDQPYLTWLYENTNEQKQDPDIIYKLVLHHFRVHRIANIKIKTLDYLLTTLHHILNASYHNLHIHVCVNLK